MSDFLEIRVRPGDRGAHNRLRDIFNFQSAADRMARWRHLWTAVVAAASIPLSLFAFQRAPPRHMAGWSLTVWATALLAVVGSGLAEWRFRRRLRSLLVQADASCALE